VELERRVVADCGIRHRLRRDEVGIDRLSRATGSHRNVESTPHPGDPPAVHVLAQQAVHGARAPAATALRVLLVREHGMGLEELLG